MTEDEIVEWHQQLNGHEFEQTSRDGEGQGSLTYCSPQGCKKLNITEQLNNNSDLLHRAALGRVSGKTGETIQS